MADATDLISTTSQTGTSTGPKKRPFETPPKRSISLTTIRTGGAARATGSLVQGSDRLSTGRHLSISGR
jgi:hypothetical protein